MKCPKCGNEKPASHLDGIETLASEGLSDGEVRLLHCRACWNVWRVTAPSAPVMACPEPVYRS